MTDDEWDLITKMCKRDPAERVDIEIVVNRLEKFIFDSEQRNKIDDAERSITISGVRYPKRLLQGDILLALTVFYLLLL